MWNRYTWAVHHANSARTVKNTFSHEITSMWCRIRQYMHKLKYICVTLYRTLISPFCSKRAQEIMFLWRLNPNSCCRVSHHSPFECQLSRVVSRDFRCKQTVKVRTLVSPTCTNFESLFQVSVYIAVFFHDLQSSKFEYRIEHPFLPTYCTWSDHK